MTNAPASGYSGESPEWIDGFLARSREGPGVPPVFGIWQQLGLIGYMVEPRVPKCPQTDRLVGIVPFMPLRPLAGAGNWRSEY
jgi:hypothetical protein